MVFCQAEPCGDTVHGAGGGVEAPGDEVHLDASVHATHGFVAVGSAQRQPESVVDDLDDGELVEFGFLLVRLLVGVGISVMAWASSCPVMAHGSIPVVMVFSVRWIRDEQRWSALGGG
ncbi:hypothetical protein O974_27595 [Mycobacterium avium 11-0986]|nr:hypothetical protein O974_27595 [Mycobacterium avium 11-0986]